MTETWLNQLHTFTTTLQQRPRTDGRYSGGIAVALTLTSTDVDCNTNCEILRTTITYNNSIITLLLTYRPPNILTLYS